MKKYKVICPLYNFQIPNVLLGPHKLSPEEVMNFFKEQEKKLVEGINLVDGVKIRRISKEDLEDLKSMFFPLPSDIRLSSNMFVLAKCITGDAHEFKTAQIMGNVVLAMRLLKSGYVSGSYVFYVLISEKRKMDSWVWNEERRRETWGLGYALNFDEIPALRKIVEKLQGVDFAKRKRLHLACKRFERAYEEVDFKDQLIDLMIAFEALFVRRETAGSSQKQKIANGCSDLLGRNEEEKEEIKCFLLKARYIRDLIAHGAEYKLKDTIGKYDIDFVPKLEDYLRDSIKKLLD